MTVAELVEELEHYDTESEVLIRPCNSIYVERVDSIGEDEVRAFYGEDYTAVIIYAESQAGAV